MKVESPRPSVSVPPNIFAWHALSPKRVLVELKSDAVTGLTADDAERRLTTHGPNLLRTADRVRWYTILARQFVNALIGILLIAAFISVAVGALGDALTILAIVVLNGLLGFMQEFKAERAIEALRHMLAPDCTVTRDGHDLKIDAATLVPGDVVILETGDRIPADLRLIESTNARVDESSLTGESVPVAKQLEEVASETPLAKRSSMLWMGTALTDGRARGVVTATGIKTEFGRIAELTQEVDRDATPLQKKLAVLARQLGIVALTVASLVLVLGVLTGRQALEMFLTAVALAVAVVPEGLPAVVTITLALGVRAMVGRRALLRRLQAAETLGAATVLCTDKTGTLTQNEMTLRKVWLARGAIDIAGEGYDPSGGFAAGGQKIVPSTRPDLLTLLETGLICSHARVEEISGVWRLVGAPTEAALVVGAYKAGLSREHGSPVVGEFLFNSRRKRMTIIERAGTERVAHVKGAPEIILDRCTRFMDYETERPLTQSDRNKADAAYQQMAAGGLRTLALAKRVVRDGVPLDSDSVERDLTLLGIVGIIDPPRPEVAQAIETARAAGIEVVMITGDAAPTAIAVARQIGLTVTKAITGSEVTAMTDEQLLNVLDDAVLFARTTPENKLDIVRVLQGRGHVVGMTGDGVNDAPALKRADIGIAMGIRGTDVSKAAADMVITDDNFASIVGAVEEGRRQFDNIKKFVRYLLSSNTAEVLAIAVNVALGGPLLLLPVQILWMNLVTDGMTAVALATEPAEPGLMNRRPRPPSAHILDARALSRTAVLGGYMALATLWLFHQASPTGETLAYAQTMAFTGLIVFEKINVLNFRAFTRPLLVVGVLTNRWLILALVTTLAMQACAVYVPFLQRLLHTVPLGWSDWAFMFLIGLPLLVFGEVVKARRYRSL